MEATKEAEIKMSVQLGPQLGQQLQWNLLSLGAPEGSMLVLSIVGTESSRAISRMLATVIMVCYLSTNILMSNWEKRTKYKTNIRIPENFVTQLHCIKWKQNNPNYCSVEAGRYNRASWFSPRRVRTTQTISLTAGPKRQEVCYTTADGKSIHLKGDES